MRPSPSAPTAARVEAAAVVAALAALRGLWSAWGGGFRIPYDLWQLLAAPELRDDLLRALADLHAQPPLLNLLLGGMLKLERYAGIAPETSGSALFFAAGVGACLLLVSLARRLVPGLLARSAVYALVLLDPFLYASMAHFFYTPLEVVGVLAIARGALAYLERPTAARLAWALGPAVLLVHLRALYHPLFLVLLAALLVARARRGSKQPVKLHVEVAALAVALCLVWPAKNLHRFGFFGFSSWSGYNFSRVSPIQYAPLFQALFLRTADRAPPQALQDEAARFVPEEDRDRPVLARVAKPDGSPNWNHWMVIATSREVGGMAVGLFAKAPGLLLERALFFYLRGFARYEGRDPYSNDWSPGGVYQDLTPAPRWAAAYEALVFQAFARVSSEHPLRVTTGFALWFPLAFAGVAWVLWRRRKDPGAEGGVVLLALGCMAWTLGLVCLVDGLEGSRIRYPVEPLFFLALAWALPRRGRAGEGARPT